MFFRNAAIFLIMFPLSANASLKWQGLANGLLYKNSSSIHFFQIDPDKFKLEIVTAKEFGEIATDAKTFAQKKRALIVINGGFFTPEYATLGLLVKDGKEINKIKWTTWWHIFQIKEKIPSVISKQDYRLTEDLEIAIEAGPRLVINGEVPPTLKPSLALRTGIGITNDNKIIMAVSEGNQISLTEFANFLLKQGCYNALNLDGGSSSQVYAKIKGFKLDRPGLNTVANGIIVLPR